VDWRHEGLRCRRQYWGLGPLGSICGSDVSPSGRPLPPCRIPLFRRRPDQRFSTVAGHHSWTRVLPRADQSSAARLLSGKRGTAGVSTRREKEEEP
jgi:hypothetical protein